MKINKVDLDNVKLALQIALLGFVTESLRAMCIKKEENFYFIIFYYHGAIDDFTKDLAETVMTEVIAHYNYDEEGREIKFVYQILRLDYPTPMPLDGEWIYYRYESQGEHDG